MRDHLILLLVLVILGALFQGQLTTNAVQAPRFDYRHATYTGQRGGYAQFTPFPLKVLTQVCGVSCCQGDSCITAHIISGMQRTALAVSGEKRKEQFVPTGEQAYRGRIRILRPKPATMNICLVTHPGRATAPVLRQKKLYFQEGHIDDTCLFRDGKMLPKITRWMAE